MKYYEVINKKISTVWICSMIQTAVPKSFKNVYYFSLPKANFKVPCLDYCHKQKRLHMHRKIFWHEA